MIVFLISIAIMLFIMIPLYLNRIKTI